MKRYNLKRASGRIIQKRKALRFTPIAIQVGALPVKKEVKTS